MKQRRTSRSITAPRARLRAAAGSSKRRLAGLALIGVGLAAAAIIAVYARPESRRAVRSRAERETRLEQWALAASDWSKYNAAAPADAEGFAEEGRALFELALAGKAEKQARRAIELGARSPTAWLVVLEVLRVEDRIFEALSLGREAAAKLSDDDLAVVLRAATIVALDAYPESAARDRLEVWTLADPDDDSARIALLKLMAQAPMAGDPPREARLKELEIILARAPERIDAREALVVELAGAGEPKRGEAILSAWPTNARDARYLRLMGRWLIDYMHRPRDAAEAFEKALETWPNDWRTWYRLARARAMLSGTAAANEAADRVRKLRDALDAETLGERLIRDSKAIDTAQARLDLAELCDRAGLADFAAAWRKLAGQAPRH